jgi:hypothetical protein
MYAKINTERNYIHVYQNVSDLGADFFQEPWREATQQEIDTYLLEKLTIAKQNKVRSLYLNLFSRKVVWEFTFQGKQYSFKINGLENAILGIQQVQARLLRKSDIDADIANSNKKIFANIDTKYINSDIGYKSLYVDIFSDFIIDRVVFKVDNNNDVSAVNNLYNLWLGQLSINYNSENLTEFNRYIKDYYTKRDEILTLLDIDSVENYDITIDDITLEIPESLIENVVLCCIL